MTTYIDQFRKATLQKELLEEQSQESIQQQENRAALIEVDDVLAFMKNMKAKYDDDANLGVSSVEILIEKEKTNQIPRPPYSPDVSNRNMTMKVSPSNTAIDNRGHHDSIRKVPQSDGVESSDDESEYSFASHQRPAQLKPNSTNQNAFAVVIRHFLIPLLNLY
jgi:hypothetical protein